MIVFDGDGKEIQCCIMRGICQLSAMLNIMLHDVPECGKSALISNWTQVYDGSVVYAHHAR